MIDVIFWGTFGLTISLIVVGLVLAAGFALHWGSERENGLIPYLFYPVFLIVTLTILLGGRNYDFISDLDTTYISKHPLVGWLSRATSLFLLIAAGERIFRRLWKPNRSALATAPLVLALTFYFFTNIICSALFSEHTSFSHEYVYTIFIGIAGLLATTRDGENAIANMRNALLALIAASALCALIRPEMVISGNYKSYLPGVNFRYAGLTNHANTFGLMMVVFLLCLWNRPFKTPWVNYGSWILGSVSLLFAQSKTSWVAFILCSSLQAYWGHRELIKQRLLNPNKPLVLASVLVFVMGSMTIISSIMMFSDLGDNIKNYVITTRSGSDLMTLTGRDQIWAVALREWKNYPVFGYGLSIWDADFRMRIGLLAAVHAHNQLYQVLSSAGSVGALGFIIYLLTLGYFSWRTAQNTKGLSVALFVMILMRSISETPLAMQSFGPDQVTHLLLLMVIAANVPNKKNVSNFPSSSRLQVGELA